MKALLISLLLFSTLFSLDIRPPHYKGDVRFIKQIELNSKFSGFNFSEISDLAYDKKHHILYMISDEGILYRYRAKFSKNDFSLIPISATYLKRKNGKRLRKWKRDTEGLALNSKGEIFISREGKPKITKFSSNGVKIKNLKLPKYLRRVKLRSRNKSLESLAFHPKYGLLTALEWPPKGVPPHFQTIYSLSGKVWHFYMENYKKNGISEIEVMDDGNILVLERAYNGIFGKFVVTLKKVFLNRCDKNHICKSKVLFKIDSAKGWHIENFEGLARVGKNRYLMISDDNKNFFEQTLLIYFEIK